MKRLWTNKSLASIFIMILIIGAFILVTNSNVSFGQSQDIVISSDTIWTKANSPYNFDRPVSVVEGITLTIESGVIISFTNYTNSITGKSVRGYLEINGTLHAAGNIADPISINGCVVFNPSSANDSKIENTIIDGEISIESSVTVNNNTIYGGIYIGRTGSPIISNNIIAGKGSGCGIGTDYSVNKIMVIGNTISGFWNGISLSAQVVIEGNLIYNNDIGIYVYMAHGGHPPPHSVAGLVIENNTIVNNNIGASLDNSIPPIFFNNFNNSRYNILRNVPQASFVVNAINNWWGTLNATLIDEKLVGNVTFSPFLTMPSQYAPLIPAIPSPTATPSLTITVTPTPTNSPLPSLTAEPTEQINAPNVTPSPTVPEFSTGILLLFIAIVTLSAIICTKRKAAKTAKRHLFLAQHNIINLKKQTGRYGVFYRRIIDETTI